MNTIETANVSYNKYFEPAEHSGICVVRRKGESQEDLLRRFRKKFSKSGLARELRERMYYEKPSVRKRRKRAQARRLREKDEEKAQEMQERFERRKKRIRKERKNDRGARKSYNRKTFEKKPDIGGDSSSG